MRCTLFTRIRLLVSHFCCSCFFQAEDGIRDLVRSRGLGDVYKRQPSEDAIGENDHHPARPDTDAVRILFVGRFERRKGIDLLLKVCLLYTSDAADERSSVDLGGRRIIKKKKKEEHIRRRDVKGRWSRNTQ